MAKKSRNKAHSYQSNKQELPLFRRSALSLAVAAALPGMIGIAATAQAQDDDDEAEVIEEVVTTGYRSALRNSMGMKKSSESIVEAISAEDIGKLPDVSIAESLARLPGLTAQRLNGRGQTISIRGLSPDFTTALMNGREQVSTGDNRGVEFDQYPSELLSSVVVYKTPDASLIGAGLAGTADMRTIRPLAHGRTTIAGNVRYEWTEIGSLNAGSPDDGVRYSLSYIDQYANDTVGLAVGYAHMTNPSQEERFNSWGYPSLDSLPFGITETDAIIGGAKPFVRSSELERDGAFGVLEWAPSDTFSTAIDVYYSEFQETQALRGIELPLAWGAWNADPTGLDPNYVTDNGLVTSGTFTNSKTVIRNDVTARDSELLAIGWNTEIAMGENWSATVDLSTSSVDRNDVILETYSGTSANGGGGTDTIGFEMIGEAGATFNTTIDYTDPNIIFLTDPNGWGGANQQVGYLNSPTIEDELNQLGASIARDLDGSISSMEFGFNYGEREKTKIADEWLLSLASGAATAPINATGITDLSFLGIPGMISYDPIAELNAGTYAQTRNPSSDVIIKSWTVNEDVALAYAQFGIDSEWGSLPVVGNFGVQVVNVDQSSTAIAAGAVSFPVTGGTDYTEVLPSVNLSFDLDNEHYIRFAAARTMARPRMDDLRASNQWSYDPNLAGSSDINNGPWSANGGNPELKPWIANSIDLAYEKYFDDGVGYVSVGVWYKDLESYIFTSNVVQSFEGYPIVGPEPVLREGIVSAPDNGEGGRMSGVEFAIQGTGEIFTTGWARDFGINFNYAYTDSSIQPDPNNPSTPIPGLSEKTSNLTVFYENQTWSARVSGRYRSDFLGEITGFGGGRELRLIAAETVVDAQLSYSFSGALQGLTLLAQGFNLTDESLQTINAADSRQVLDYQRYGRSYMLGASYRWE